MSCYTIPAMGVRMEFHSLDYLAKYADHMMATTDDVDYSVVHEWGDHGPGPYPPLAVLYRVDGQWIRRDVLVTIIRRKDGSCDYTWTVNDH